MGAAWVLLFGVLVTETPETHWGISQAELDHIVRTRPRPAYACSSSSSSSSGSSAGSTMINTSITGTTGTTGTTNKTDDNDRNDGNTRGATPFAAFVRLPAFWGTVTAHFCYNYMSFLALSLGPYFFSTYNIDINHFNATGPSTGMNLGYIACLPYIVLFASQFAAGILADYLHNKGVLSLTQVRKLFNTLGMLCAVVFFALLASPVVQQGPTDRAGVMTALLFLSGAVGFGGVAIVGHWANYHDLSPKYGSLPPMRSCCATHAAEPALPADPFAKAARQGGPSRVRLVVGCSAWVCSSSGRCHLCWLSAGCGRWFRRYGAVLLGIGTSIATVPGMICNIVSGEILDRIQRDPSSTDEAWALVFIIASAVSLLGAVVFCCLGSAEQVDFDASVARSHRQRAKD